MNIDTQKHLSYRDCHWPQRLSNRAPTETIALSLVLIIALMLTSLLPAMAQTVEELHQLGIQSQGEVDLVNAIRQFEQAAERGYAPAQYQLGWIMDGAEMNEQAVKWYRKAAEQGNADGQFWLGVMYSNGEGIEQNKTKAFQWIQKAALQNYASAMDLISKAYEEGLLDLEPDADIARAWVDRGLAAEQPWAIQRMALALRNGELGVEINTERADELDEKLKAIISRP